ncbi:MAG: TIGR02186 family protein, partial [Alphaproteobacteria bacterium]
MRFKRRARTRGIARFAALLVSLAAPQAQALDLETDLSTHYIEIRTTFRGAALTVFGSLSGQSEDEERPDAPKIDVIVVVKGPAETLAVRRKEQMGPIWANGLSFTANNVPSFYFVASTRPVDEIVDPNLLDRYHIGLDHLGVDFTAGPARAIPPARPAQASNDDLLPSGLPVSGSQPTLTPISTPALPGIDQRRAFQDALVRLLKSRNTFSDQGTVTFVRPHLFRAEISIPSTVPEGDYGTEVYVVRNRQLLDAEYTVFFIDKKGLEGKV